MARYQIEDLLVGSFIDHTDSPRKAAAITLNFLRELETAPGEEAISIIDSESGTIFSVIPIGERSITLTQRIHETQEEEELSNTDASSPYTDEEREAVIKAAKGEVAPRGALISYVRKRDRRAEGGLSILERAFKSLGVRVLSYGSTQIAGTIKE